MAIDPNKLADKVLKNTLGEQHAGNGKPWSDDDAINIYNFARPSVYSTWGRILQIDVAGCNYRCGFCWVHNEALAGHKGAGNFLNRKKEDLPGKLKNKDKVSSTELWSEMDAKLKRFKGDSANTNRIAFSGGEPTLYRGALHSFAVQAAQRDYETIVYTHGQHIADHDDYLDPFYGLEEFVKFSVSVKGSTAENFTRTTGVDRIHMDKGYDALKKLYQHGFFAIPYAPLLNVTGSGDVEKNISELHKKFSNIHPDLPRAVVYDKVTAGSVVHDPKSQSKHMAATGLRGTKPSRTEKMLLEYFADNGTPIIPIDAQNPRADGKGGALINKIRNELRVS